MHLEFIQLALANSRISAISLVRCRIHIRESYMPNKTPLNDTTTIRIYSTNRRLTSAYLFQSQNITFYIHQPKLHFFGTIL